MKNALLTLAALTLALIAKADSFQSTVDRFIKGTVPLISTEELAKKLADSEELIILDTRHDKEFSVSHLPNAQHVGFLNFDSSKLESLNKQELVIVYCSVGYRSERIGENLQAAGFTRVRNLYGGLFAWANEKRPLENANGPTSTVHGFNAEWSKLLDPQVPRVIE